MCVCVCGCAWVCVSVCVTEMGCTWGGTRLVRRDLHTLYCVYVNTSGCNRGAAAKVDANGEQ